MKLNFESAKNITLKYNLFVLGTFTLAAVVIWVSYSLYDTYMRSTIEPEVKDLLRPLDPSIEISIIEELQQRRRPPLEFTITAIEGTGSDQRVITINPQGNQAFAEPIIQPETRTTTNQVAPESSAPENNQAATVQNDPIQSQEAGNTESSDEEL